MTRAAEIIQEWIDLDEGFRHGASSGIGCRTEFLCAAIQELAGVGAANPQGIQSKSTKTTPKKPRSAAKGSKHKDKSSSSGKKPPEFGKGA